MRPPRPTTPEWLRPYLPVLATLIVALLGGGAIALEVDPDGAGPQPPHRVRIVQVQPADPGPPITAPAAQVEKVAEQAEDVNQENLQGEALSHEHEKGEPLTDAQIAANDKAADRAGVTGLEPTLAFGASFEQRGCRTMPIGVNFSSRPAGVRPTLIGAAHITVSNEVTGWGDVLGIRSFFGRLGVGASSHYVIDGEGHCAYIVPESAKAWTSGNMNPLTACNIEMIGQPDANGWMRPAGMAKAALVLGDCARRWGIPVQAGNTSGCSVLKAGLVDHNELECGNDHWDICSTAEKARTSGSNPCPLVAKILAAMRDSARTLTGVEHRIVTSARKPKGTGHTRRYWCRRLGAAIGKISTGEKHRRPARRRILHRVWRGSCTGSSAAAGSPA